MQEQRLNLSLLVHFLRIPVVCFSLFMLPSIPPLSSLRLRAETPAAVLI